MSFFINPSPEMVAWQYVSVSETLNGIGEAAWVGNSYSRDFFASLTSDEIDALLQRNLFYVPASTLYGLAALALFNETGFDRIKTLAEKPPSSDTEYDQPNMARRVLENFENLHLRTHHFPDADSLTKAD